MPKKKSPPPRPSEEEIRRLVHRYFHDRYRNGRGERGKTGIATTISIIKKELKERHELTQQEVMRSITYLMDEGWVTRDDVEKAYVTDKGTRQPSVTSYYRITSAGVDKIEGEGDYTNPKVHSGVSIEATGRNVITIGDGNHVDAAYSDVGDKLVAFKDAVRESDLAPDSQLDIIADIETIEAQLIRAKPRPRIVQSAWEGIKKATTGTALAANVATLAMALRPLLLA